MKKTIFTVIILILTVSAFADTYIQVGYLPGLSLWDLNPGYEKDEFTVGEFSDAAIFYTELGSEYELLNIYNSIYMNIDGNIRTYVIPQNNSWTMYPFYLSYKVGVNITYKTLEVGFNHSCSHPQNLLEGYVDPIVSEQSAYDEFYIRFNIKK